MWSRISGMDRNAHAKDHGAPSTSPTGSSPTPLPRQAHRLDTISGTIFSTMTALAAEHNAINLGQGFPDSDGPDSMLERAVREIRGGTNQYAPGRGFPELRQAIAADREQSWGQHFDWQSEVLVTVGATEAISTAILAYVNPGDEVIVIEPYYDVYASATALAGGTVVPVPLKVSDQGFSLDPDALRRAISPRSTMLIINSPHNPTGMMLSREDLEAIAKVATEANLVVLADEVYEKLVFDTQPHIPIATLPGMRERTITVSSAAKTLNATGWKTGWALGPAELLHPIEIAKQNLTFVGASPVQPAVAHALVHEREWISQLTDNLHQCRDILDAALVAAGFSIMPTQGSYYIVADPRPLGYTNGDEFCRGPLIEAGVAGIPLIAFASSADKDRFAPYVRFAFCKRPEVLREAARRLLTIRRADGS